MSSGIKEDKPVKSPCIGVCALDEEDICKGCYRTAQEITFWSTFDNDQKRRIVIRASHTAKARGMLL